MISTWKTLAMVGLTWAALVHASIAAIIGVDNRDTISLMGPKLGLSGSEIEQIRQSTGELGCLKPGNSSGVDTRASGVLVGSNMIVVTAAHIFSGQGGKPYFPASDICGFVADHSPKVRTNFNFDAPGSWVSPEPNEGTEDADFAVVVLSKPVPGATPFDYLSEPVLTGTKLIKVSALEVAPVAHPVFLEPIVAPCEVTDQIHSALMVLTDCDSTQGASGGATLMRNSLGTLVVVGITKASSYAAANGSPYSRLRNVSVMEATQGSLAERISATLATLDRSTPGLIVVDHKQ